MCTEAHRCIFREYLWRKIFYNSFVGDGEKAGGGENKGFVLSLSEDNESYRSPTRVLHHGQQELMPTASGQHENHPLSQNANSTPLLSFSLSKMCKRDGVRKTQWTMSYRFELLHHAFFLQERSVKKRAPHNVASIQIFLDVKQIASISNILLHFCSTPG